MTRACCFTGHRDLPPVDSEEYKTLCRALDRAINDALKLGCAAFYAGGAVGFDMIAAERVLVRARRRTKNPIRLILCIPHKGHHAAFSAGDQRRIERLIAKADEVHYISEKFAPECFAERNRFMIEHSDVCIAYVRRMQSGSGQTVRMAQQKRRIIIPI